MAQGDATLFTQFLVDMGDGLHDLSSASIHIALVDNTTTPSANTADPRWGAGGTTNFSSNEVTAGGNYTAAGRNISDTSPDNWTSSGTTVALDFADVTWTQNASNPTGAYWGIIYNESDAGKRCVGFVEVGTNLDLTTGDLSITWDSNGFLKIS